MRLTVIIGSILLALILIVLLAGYLLVMLTFTKKQPDGDPEPEDPVEKLHWRNATDGMRRLKLLRQEEWTVVTPDRLTLHATFVPAETPGRGTILCVHGYHCHGWFEYGNISHRLHAEGYDLLIPDNRAHGRSDGRILGFGVRDARDVLLWCEQLRQKQGPDCRIVLYGVSMGSATVLNASGLETLPRNVVGVVGDCGFSSGWDEICIQIRSMFHLPPFPFLHAADLWLRLLAGYSLKELEPKRQIRKTKVPLLIIHGSADTFVPTHMGHEIYENATCDKRLTIIEGARHAQSYDTDPETYMAAFNDLLKRAGL